MLELIGFGITLTSGNNTDNCATSLMKDNEYKCMVIT